VEIIEAHHNKKKDAPSGTAAKAAQVISEVLAGRDLRQGEMRSVFMLSGAAMWWGTILCCSLAMVSVSRYGTRPTAGRRLLAGL